MAYNNFHRNCYTDGRYQPQLQCQSGSIEQQPYMNFFQQDYNNNMLRQSPPVNSYHEIYSQPHAVPRNIARDRWNWLSHYRSTTRRYPRPYRRQYSHLDDIYGPNFEKFNENHALYRRQKRSSDKEIYRRTPKRADDVEKHKDENLDSQSKLENRTDTNKTDLSICDHRVDSFLPIPFPVGEYTKVETMVPTVLENELISVETCTGGLDIEVASQQNMSIRRQTPTLSLTSSSDSKKLLEKLGNSLESRQSQNHVRKNEVSHLPISDEIEVKKHFDLLPHSEDSTSKIHCKNICMNATINTDPMEKTSSHRHISQKRQHVKEKSIETRRDCLKKIYTNLDKPDSKNLPNRDFISEISDSRCQTSVSGNKMHNDLESRKMQLKCDIENMSHTVPESSCWKSKMEHESETICLDNIDTLKSYLHDTDNRNIEMETDSRTPQKKRKLDISNDSNKVHHRRNSEQSGTETMQCDRSMMRRTSLDSQQKRMIDGFKEQISKQDLNIQKSGLRTKPVEGLTLWNKTTKTKIKETLVDIPDKSSKQSRIGVTNETHKKQCSTEKKENKSRYSGKYSDKSRSFKIPKKNPEMKQTTFSDAHEQFRNGIKHLITPNRMIHLFGSDGSDEEKTVEHGKSGKVSDNCRSVGGTQLQNDNAYMESFVKVISKKRAECDKPTSNKMKKKLSTDATRELNHTNKHELNIDKFEGNTTSEFEISLPDKSKCRDTKLKSHEFTKVKRETQFKWNSKNPSYKLRSIPSMKMKHPPNSSERESSSRLIQKSEYDSLKEEALSKERRIFVNMSIENLLYQKSPIISIIPRRLSDVLPKKVTISENRRNESTITKTVIDNHSHKADMPDVTLQYNVQKAEIDGAEQETGDIRKLQLLNTAVQSEIASQIIECRSLAAFELPLSNRAYFFEVDCECLEEAIEMDSPEIKKDVESVRNNDTADEVIEIQQVIPLIDLTRNSDKIDEDNFDTSEADLMRVLEETKVTEKITLYRSEETFNNSLEIQAMCASITPSVERFCHESEFKPDLKDITIGSRDTDLATLTDTESNRIASTARTLPIMNSNTEGSILTNQVNEDNKSNSLTTIFAVDGSRPELSTINNQPVDISETSRIDIDSVVSNEGSNEGSNVSHAPHALNSSMKKPLDDLDIRRVNAQISEIETSEVPIISPPSRDDTMGANVNGNEPFDNSNSVLTIQNRGGELHKTLPKSGDLPNMEPEVINSSISGDSNKNKRQLLADSTRNPVSAGVDFRTRISSVQIDPNLSPQEYALSGVIVPYALFIISLKRIHEYYFDNLNKEISFIPNLLRTEINIQMRVFSKKIAFYANSLCTDLKKLKRYGNMLTSTAQLTLNWIFDTIKYYKPNSTKTSFVVSLYQLMEPHHSFFIGDSYLSTFYNVLRTYYEQLRGRLPSSTTNAVYLSAQQRNILECQIGQYQTLVGNSQQMNSALLNNSSISSQPYQNDIVHPVVGNISCTPERTSTNKSTVATKRKHATAVSQNPSIGSLENVVNNLNSSSACCSSDNTASACCATGLCRSNQAGLIHSTSTQHSATQCLSVHILDANKAHTPENMRTPSSMPEEVVNRGIQPSALQNQFSETIRILSNMSGGIQNFNQNISARMTGAVGISDHTLNNSRCSAPDRTPSHATEPFVYPVRIMGETQNSSFASTPASHPEYLSARNSNNALKSSLAAFQLASANTLRAFKDNAFTAPKTPQTSTGSVNIDCNTVQKSLASKTPTSSEVSPPAPNSSIQARVVHQDTPFHHPIESESSTSCPIRSNTSNVKRNIVPDTSSTSQSSVDASNLEQSLERNKHKPSIALKKLDHLKSPVYAPMLFNPPEYEEDDSVPEPTHEPVIDTIDLTWIEEVNAEEIQKEMDFVVVKKEEPNDDEVILNQEQFPVAIIDEPSRSIWDPESP